MNGIKDAPKSILEDIFDEMFNIIEKANFFDNVSIIKLRELSYDKNFRREKEIIEAIELKKDDKE